MSPTSCQTAPPRNRRGRILRAHHFIINDYRSASDTSMQTRLRWLDQRSTVQSLRRHCRRIEETTEDTDNTERIKLVICDHSHPCGPFCSVFFGVFGGYFFSKSRITLLGERLSSVLSGVPSSRQCAGAKIDERVGKDSQHQHGDAVCAQERTNRRSCFQWRVVH
jgi:hypothetical protein